MNRDQLLFGVAYYREYMPYERLDQDIEMMKKAHINYVRIGESTWSTYEKDDGVFDFSSLLIVLDKMHAAGISVIVGTPTYAIPSWLARKYPDILAETQQGRNRYGARQLMDITHPAYLYYGDRIITKMLEAVHNHPAIIGYQLDNETKYYGCVSPNVQIAFVKHLKQYYQERGGLKQLNADFGLDYWSNRIDSWEDFPDVRDTINGSLACAFKKFQRSLVTTYLQHQADLVRPYLKDGQFLTHNFDFEWRNYSFGVQPDVDHFAAAKCLDVVGCDIYHPGQEDLTGKEIAFGGDEIYAIADQRYFVLETEAQAFKNWTPFPGQLYLQAMAHLASGAQLIGYWHWHSLHNSFETYWKGLLSHDFKANPVYNEACQIGADLEKLQPVLAGFRKERKVCLVVSNECLSSIDYFPYHGPSLNTVKYSEHLYNDVVRAYYDALYEENIEADIRTLSDERIFDYDLLVLPLLYTASDEQLQKLNEFVRRGGHVIYSFKSGYADEHVKVRTVDQPGVISEVTGCTYQLIAEPRHVTLDGSAELNLDNVDSTLSDFLEMVAVDAQRQEQGDVTVLARYHHQYYQQYAAITYAQKQGEGSATYIGANVPKAVIAKVADYVVKRNQLLPERVSCKFPLIVRSAVNGQGQKVHFVLNFSCQNQSLPNPYGRCRAVLTGKEYEHGEVLELKDWGALVLQELN